MMAVLKPSGRVIKEFASIRMRILKPRKLLKVDVRSYYSNPYLQLREAFKKFKEIRESFLEEFKLRESVLTLHKAGPQPTYLSSCNRGRLSSSLTDPRD